MTGREFPFGAVVGQEEAQQALLLAAVDPAIGGVLLRGDKGSAKTTLARGLAQLLPGDAPFVELPVGATEDRVLGTLDVRALLENSGDPSGAFRPGLLAAADGGVLYVDEVNLLPDQIVDGLLDAAATGVHRVERDGVSHEHPARFVLLGSMNPEEGELRPQLLDRFGLAVEVRSPEDPGVRAEAVRRRLAHDRGAPVPQEDDALRRRLATAEPAPLPDDVVTFAAGLAVAVGAESLRADLVLCRAGAALAGWEGRAATRREDVERVAPLVLGHRRRRRPFDPPTLQPEELKSALEEAQATAAGAPEGGARGPGPDAATPNDPADTAGPSGPPGSPDPVDPPLGPEASEAGGPLDSPEARKPDHQAGPPGSGTHPSGGASTAVGDRWDDLAGTALTAGTAPVTLPGGRLRPRPQASPDGTGRVAGHGVPGPEGPRGVAVLPTVRAAAVRQATAPGSDGARSGQERPVSLQPEDVREPHRVRKERRTIIVAVDTSGSMGTAARVRAATGAVLGLLADAYLGRDQVALIAFRGETAVEVLPATGSVELARAHLAELPTGGSTPLAEGISLALSTARRAAAKDSTPLLVLLTDGRATGAATELADPLEDARGAARAVADSGIEAIVLDAEDGSASGLRLGLAAELADLMQARYQHLATPTASAVESAVRHSL